MNSFLVTVLIAWTSLNGTIEGRVTLRPLPRQLVANRYPGAGSGAAHELKPLPVIVYIEGQVSGANVSASDKAQMAQRDTSFQPTLVTVPVGSTVRFPNEDKFFHNVFSYSKTKRFDLGRYPRGEAKTVTFDQPGTVTVFCEIHKWMRSAIIVVENSFHAEVGSDGTFRIPNVPAGKYKLILWHPERGRKAIDVIVPASGVVKVDATL